MSTLGSYSLQLALLFACTGAGLGVYAGIAQRDDWSQVAERCVGAVFALISVAMLALFYALATNEFSNAYVAAHSARSMDLGYRLSALWGGQAGSLLLWVWMLSLYAAGAMYANRHHHRELAPWVAAVLLGNAIFFLALLTFSTNPFELVPPAHRVSDGNGLNPLLQHPVMLIHPLMLYTGFVGFAVPFAYAFAALITGRLDTTWFRITRRWALFAWAVLGVGLMLGGRWAYEVLGWGGYWAWDPVENAALMPWLVATAYLHSVMIQEKRDMLKIWNLVLIGLTYSLCLFGTFLTRSGIVQSVHAFTNAGWFTPLFLSYTLLVSIGFFVALIARSQMLRSTNRLESVVSREASFLINNWLFMALLIMVFWFTMYPVFTELVIGEQRTWGPVWYNLFGSVIGLGLLFMTGFGPLIAWRRATATSLRRQFQIPGGVGFATAAVLAVWLRREPMAIAYWGMCAFVATTITQEYTQAIAARMRRGESPLVAFATLLRKNQRRYGGYIVHLGIVFAMLGIAGAAFNQESLANVRPGDSTELGAYRFEYLTAEPIPKQHYGGARARVALYRDEEPLAVMAPEKRMYWLEQQPSSIPAIYSTLREDVYLILTAIEPDGSATLKVYRNPLVNWLWIGIVTFSIGSIVVMWPPPVRPREA
ncbi:MAG: heme lyase CcmF/NrfE family subunit [Myxococcota bacterium]|nr:heme lyase CcmF/NrfE family subunit [Myxococcota bacterium]